MGSQHANMPISQDSLLGGFQERSHLFRLADLVSTTNVQLIWSTDDPIHQPDYLKVGLEAYIQHPIFSVDMGLGP